MKPRPPSTARLSFPLAAAIASLFAAQSMHAANIWDGGAGTGAWNTANNWDNNVVPVANATLTFAGNTQNSTNNDTTADRIYNGFLFTNNGAGTNTNGFTLAGNRITLGSNITTTANTAGATITDTISLNMILNGDRTITTNQQNASVQHNLTISGILSETGGARALTKAGGGTLILSGANTYSGATTLGTAGSVASGGTLTVSGAAGTINASSGYTINGSGSKLLLDNTAGDVDRLKNTSGVTLNLGGELSLTGNATTNSTETVASLALGTGSSIVTVASAAGRVSTLDVTGGITRTNRSTALVRGTSLSQSVANNVSRITLGTAPTGADFVGTNTLSGGATGDTTQALKIVPWLFGDTSASGTGNGFVTYDSTLGLRVLTAAQMTTLSAGSTTAANPVNALAFNGTVTTSGLTVNSLLFNTNSQTLNGSGALTVNSGAVASVVSSAVIGSGYSSLVLGNGEGILTSTTGSFSINTPVDVTSSGGLTKTGGGNVLLGASNLYTGQTTVNQGQLIIGFGTAGDLGSNTANIVLNGGGLSFGRTNSGLTLSNTISGSGSVTQNTAGGTTVLSGENTYTGTTTVSAGTLTLTGNRTVTATGGYTVSGTGTQTLNIQGGSYGLGGNFVIGSNSTGATTVNHSAGTISSVANGIIMGNGAGTSNSFYNLSGTGSLTSASIIMGSNSGTSAAAPHTNTIAVSGTGALTSTTLRIGRYDFTGVVNTTNTFTQTGGTTTVGTLGLGGSSTNASDSTGPIIANLNLTGGTFSATTIASLSAGGAASALNANSSFINIGGTAQVTLGAIPTARGTNSTATITFDSTTGGGGFLAPQVASATYMPAGTFTNAYLTANGANFNVGSGKDITIGQVLQNAPAAAGTLTKSGVGTMTLSGTNTYTGATTLSAGTLSVATIGNGGVAGNLGQATNDASNLVFAGGALSYSGATASSDRSFTMQNAAVNSIGVTNAASTLTLTGSSPTNTGVLRKDGAGGLTLNPGVGGSYSLGALQSNGGTLTLKSGTFTTSSIDPTSGISDYFVGAGTRNDGTLTVDGAALSVTGAGTRRFVIGAASNGTGNLISGSITAPEVYIGHNGVATMTQSGGTLTTNTLAHIDGGSGTYTLTGGTLIAQTIYNGTLGANAFTLNLNGGTLQARAGTTNLIRTQGAGTTQISVLLGTGNTQIDTSVSSATIARPMGDMSGQAGTFTKTGANTLTLTEANTYTGATTISGGTLALGANGSIISPNIIVGANTTFNVSGVTGGYTLGATQTLSGTGSVVGATVVAGTLSPGNSIGTMNFTNTLSLAGISNFEIDPLLGLGLNADRANVTNGVTYGGTLNVLYSGSNSNFTNGMIFNLFDGSSFSGSFTAVNLPSLDGTGLSWQNDLLSNGSLTIIPEPNVAALIGALGGILLLRRRR